MSTGNDSPSIKTLVRQWQEISSSLRDGGRQPPGGRGALEAAGAGDDEVGLHLIEMLSTAVHLEFATIPPYLCALWSIKDELHPVAKSLREIVQEEMLHMGLACNMLAAIDGDVTISNWAPTYPAKLPGGVHEGLTVWLQGLNKGSLGDFIRIETPDELAPNVPVEKDDPDWSGSETIGEFYHCILDAFQHYKNPLKIDRQVTASLVWRLMTTIDDVKWAIGLITTQGEGAQLEEGPKSRMSKSKPKSSPRDSSKEDYAHYYRFLEMWKQKRLVRCDSPSHGEHYLWQEGFAMPKCDPMGRVPEGGFSDEVAPSVRQLLTDFDRAYSEMLVLLDKTWEPGGQGNLIHAIARMFDLEKYAKPLMQIKRPDKPEFTYGPQFRFRKDLVASKGGSPDAR